MAKSVKTSSTTETSSRGRRVELTGEVVASKMAKTISVLVYRTVRHEKYGKFVKLSTVLKAHDPHAKAKTGDTVRICESRPISKTKRWTLVEVVKSST